MSDYREKLNKYEKITKFLLYVPGFSSTAPSEIRMGLTLSCAIYMIWISSYNIIVAWTDWQEVTLNMIIFLASLLTVKLANYVVRRKNFYIFMKIIREDFWYANESRPDSEKKIILEHALLASTFQKFHAMVFSVTGPTWLILPVIKMFLLSDKEHFSRVLPFKTWTPFQLDAYSDPIYGIQYSIQSFNLCYSLTGLAAMDCLFFYLVLNTCGQFRLLQERIRNFNKNTDGVEVNLKTQEINIKNCIKQHQNLLEFCTNLDDNLTEMLLVQMFVNCTFLCMACFMSTFPGNTFTYIQSGLAVCASLSQSFLHCYCASRLTTESLNVATAAYDCEWYKSSPSIRKNILFLIMRGQKPIILKAGKLMPISVETFEMITRTAVSYCTVLNSMNEEN